MSSFRIKRNDTAPELDVVLEADERPVGITGATVRFLMMDSAGRLKVDRPAENQQIGDGADGTKGSVVYRWRPEDTDTAGRFRAELEATYPDGTVRTFPNPGFMTIIVEGDLG